MSAYKQTIIKGVVADDTFQSPTLSEMYSGGIASITLYSDETMTTPVKPTAGSVTLSGSSDNFSWKGFNQGTIDVSSEDLNQPNWGAPLSFIKAEMSGVVGATHFKLRINQYL